MRFDGEPKDGDFVRYIEMLNREAGGTPGAVPKPKRNGFKLSLPKPAWGRDDADSTSAPANPRTSQPRANKTVTPGATREDDDTSATTLAARSSQRHLSLGLGIAAVVALWSALHKLFEAISTHTLDLDALVPVIFLLVCAGMLFKGARGVRQKADRPAPPLPPLTTVPKGRKPTR